MSNNNPAQASKKKGSCQQRVAAMAGDEHLIRHLSNSQNGVCNFHGQQQIL